MNLSYHLIRISGFLLSSLPLSLLYVVADFFAWFIYRIIPYRKKVVIANLNNAFPEKSDKEINQIALGFYKNLTKTLVEILKLFRFDAKYLPERVEIINKEILEQYYASGKSVVVVTGHYTNWEWPAIAIGSLLPFRAIGVYKPLSNAAVNRLMIQIRSQNGLELIPVKQAFKTIQASKVPTLSYLIADQAPNPENAFWTQFLNQDTPVFLGPERIARLTNSAVVFFEIRRVGIGHIKINVRKLCDDPLNETENAITEKHVRALEKQILEDPAPWLWSHKRWKHKRP